jgi:hypothetical protein
MDFKTNFTLLLCAFLFAACTPSGEEGSKYVGSWHSAPIVSGGPGKQGFIDIVHENGPNYIATSYLLQRKAFGDHGIYPTNKVKTAYTLKEGKLVGGQLDAQTLFIDVNGALQYGGMEYRK